MATTTYPGELVYVPRAGTLYDVLELILDRGMVIDVFLRVSLVGIEVLRVDARIVVASVDTYLRFAEVCNRLDLEGDQRILTVPELFQGGGPTRRLGKRKMREAAESVGSAVRHAVGADSDDDAGEHEAEKVGAPEGSRQHRGTSTTVRRKAAKK